MRPRGGILFNKRWKKALAAALCLIMIGGMVAGWSIHNATDPTRVEPIAVPNDIEFKSGDIIVAGGVSLQSRLVLALTEDNQYSHVGLIQATPLGLFVIHAAPNGAGDGGVGDKVARIPLSLFLAERGYVAVQVMRLKSQTAEAQELAQDACDFAMACAEQDVPFDSDYDLADDRTVYCSELIYLAYKQAGETWPDTLIGHYDNLMVQGPGITPGAFTRATALETIWQNQPERKPK